MAIYSFQNQDELAEILLQVGDQYFDRGEYDKSYLAYDKASKQIQSPRCYYNLGILELKSGDQHKAQVQLKKAKELVKGQKDEVRVTMWVFRRFLENGMIAKEEALKQVDLYMKDVQLLQQDKDELFAFLCWYYDEINEVENSITSFLQIQDLELRRNLLAIYQKAMVKENKWNAMEMNIRDLKEAYPYEVQMTLLKVLLKEGKVQEALNLLNMLEAWKKNRNEENLNDLMCYKAHAYLRLKQVIMAIDALNRVEPEGLSEEEAYIYDTSICQLAQLNNNYTKEEEGYYHMIEKIKKKYRKMELGKVEIYEGFF